MAAVLRRVLHGTHSGVCSFLMAGFRLVKRGRWKLLAICLALFSGLAAADPTPTPCSDVGYPYGRPWGPGQEMGYCYNCAGEKVGLVTLPDASWIIHCVALDQTMTPTPPVTITPTPTRTISLLTPTPTRKPLIIYRSYPLLDIPTSELGARAVSHLLLATVNMMTGYDFYEIQFNSQGPFVADYQGPFPPKSDLHFASGFFWPCDPKGTPPGDPLTGRDCRASVGGVDYGAHSFAYRLHGPKGWTKPIVQTYLVLMRPPIPTATQTPTRGRPPATIPFRTPLAKGAKT